MKYEVVGTPQIEDEYSDQWETVMTIDLKREDGETGNVWIVAGVPDYQRGTALAAASGRESTAASFSEMMTVRCADFGSWDAWCGFERPDDDDEASDMAAAIIATVRKAALAEHQTRLNSEKVDQSK